MYKHEISINNEPFYLEKCSYSEEKSTWREYVAIYPYYRIYLVTEGGAMLHLKDRKCALKPGYLYFVPAFSVISGNCDTILKHYYLHLSPKYEEGIFLRLHPPLHEVQATKIDFLLFKEIIEAFPKNDFSSILKVKGIFQYLLSKFYKNSTYFDNESMRFQPALDYINEHIGESISTTKLAQVSNLSKVYFSNLFGKIFGISPMRYIIRKKMDIAAKRLIETNDSVKEISYYVGYDNEMYFSRLFKKEFGISPSFYRKEFFKQSENK